MLYIHTLGHDVPITDCGELELGSVRPRYIKNAARTLLQLYPDTFTEDFESNKRLVEQLTDVKTKKVRNRIAGYLVTLIKIGIAREAAESEEHGEELPEDLEM
jgi:small subunit ribosomal protein S17e